jgi:hypothetical protein
MATVCPVATTVGVMEDDGGLVEASAGAVEVAIFPVEATV